MIELELGGMGAEEGKRVGIRGGKSTAENFTVDFLNIFLPVSSGFVFP